MPAAYAFVIREPPLTLRMTSAAVPSRSAKSPAPQPPSSRRGEPILFEIAWEAANKVGGIYTVLRSKIPAMLDRWGNRYCLVGPYDAASAAVEFEPAPLIGTIGQAVKQLREQGFEAHYGRWLVTGRPHIVLLDHLSVFERLHEVKYRLWNDHGISLPTDDAMLNNVVAFSEICKQFLWLIAHKEASRRRIVAHFHEWMTGAAIPQLRQGDWPGSLVFTTHATLLGRYLAMNDDSFYEHLPYYDAHVEAKKYLVEAQHRIECAAAHGSHVFTTVSDVTADECRHLLGRRPDVLLPNGLNIQRFAAVHELQNRHRRFKEQIHRFTIGHFFPSYPFDLDKTLYFFTSGRFEYRNKGMDVTIDALARLNRRMKSDNRGVTVVAIIVTKRPVRSVNVTALQSRAMLDEFETITDAVKQQIGEKLFYAAVAGQVPQLDTLVEDYWLLRLRRAMQAWNRDLPPGIVTHDLVDDQDDQVLNQLRACGLWNQQQDPVKGIYHPDFINPSNPLFGMEYEQFVRGCHLGIFPSYYEPWGYTPLESIALGVPAVTSDLTGFGAYLQQLLPDHEKMGLYVVPRRGRQFHDVADALADRMYRFCQLTRRERMAMRNSAESFSEHFDWHNLGKCYHEAHELAMDRVA